ncbi:YqcI/YcgG family protein [Rossellomorea aquimaris]|uniref:YqcI/YcgG family protein n=1 Tax=Rossellomorea aquimaris TaxID=189382 RepID=UPI001CD7B042|nr:YqcI/YcgG family protein [Rossellomorea aquimaris]MCA1055446.1 YqcI/YcgG family protein [Rossellomorea aquimaris]
MLYRKTWIDEHIGELPQWQQHAYTHFSNMMVDDQQPYPCVPGIQGFLKDTLRFGFAGDPRNAESIEELATFLQDYGEISRGTGDYASLVVFFDSEELNGTSTEQYEDLFWSVLNRVHELDETPWPDEISKDPHDHTWEFCFNGEPYFAFCATPAHDARKSRHFPYLLLAFQPRWVFDKINSSTPFGQKLKKVIRKRLAEFDEIDVHPSLKWYGQEDNHEWEQYFLRDDDSSLSKCPFLNSLKKLKS